MSFYGIGPPRSGTMMLGKCLSVVQPVFHESARKNAVMWPIINKAVVEAAQAGSSFRYWNDDANEVAWYLTFAERTRPTIYMHRPYEKWLGSMAGRGLLDHGAWMLGLDDPVLVYQAYLERADGSLVLDPSGVIWEYVLEWLGWEATEEQLFRMYEIAASKPNARQP